MVEKINLEMLEEKLKDGFTLFSSGTCVGGLSAIPEKNMVHENTPQLTIAKDRIRYTWSYSKEDTEKIVEMFEKYGYHIEL